MSAGSVGGSIPIKTSTSGSGTVISPSSTFIDQTGTGDNDDPINVDNVNPGGNSASITVVSETFQTISTGADNTPLTDDDILLDSPTSGGCPETEPTCEDEALDYGDAGPIGESPSGPLY